MHNTIRAGLMTILALAGCAVSAQQASWADVPVAAVPAPGAAVAAATNAAGRPDAAKVEAIVAELSGIARELRSQEMKLQTTDAEIKALLEKKLAAQQVAMELEKQRRELTEKKLSDDPKFAPLVARRRALQQSLKDLGLGAGPAPRGAGDLSIRPSNPDPQAPAKAP